ncbi:Uncharacterised protein [Vibrio cholerae]|nr:Uncharacterised protein [Vibrio cholerae]
MSSIWRYFTASKHSAYLVAMPNRAASHIQNRAPGPPSLIAVATPTMFPVPMVAERAVHNAAKLDTSPCLSEDFSRPNTIAKAVGRRRNCSKPKRKVK